MVAADGVLPADQTPAATREGIGRRGDERRPGFYPTGGGEATLCLWPSSPDPFHLDAAGSTDVTTRVYSKASADLADADVAERQAATAENELAGLGIGTTARKVTYAETASPGSSVVVRLASDRVTDHVATTLDVVDAFGFDLSTEESGATPVVETGADGDGRS